MPDRSSPSSAGAPVSPATLRRLERGSGALATTCLAAMDEQLPWFSQLPADQRSGVLLVVQTGVANFVAWLTHPGGKIRADAFRIAPRDLARRLSLRQTVELVRTATDVFELHLPPLAADAAEHRVLVEAILRFGREIAFAAATVYAGAAETRGAWDARLEALVVDAVVRGEADDAMVSRAAALGFDPASPVRVVAGNAASDTPDSRSAGELLGDLRRHATRAGRTVLVGVQGNRLVVVLSETARPHGDGLGRLVEGFGPGPVVIGPVAPHLTAAHTSAREALAGLRAAPGRPDAPRPVAAEDLLPERALCGDDAAHRALVDGIVVPLRAAGGALLDTLTTYLDGGGALESCARTLFVHPNTVRYRLRRIGEVTGHLPTVPRDALVLRTALVAARLNPYNDQPV